jgi:NTP pyrophosphatase (non-canonical NTP hydrolase)
MQQPVDDLTQLIQDYYQQRGLKWPDNINQSLGWCITEIGETYELLLARDGGWKRNNPEDHQEFDSLKLAEELGDAVMMLIVAGIVEGVDVIRAMKGKIARKLEAEREGL